MLYTENFRNGFIKIIKDQFILNRLVKTFIEFLFGYYFEEMIFSISSRFYKNLKDYYVNNHNFKFIDFNNRKDLQSDKQKPIKQFKNEKEITKDFIIANLQNDLVLLKDFLNNLENSFKNFIQIEIGENYLKTFIKKIDSIHLLTYCPKNDITNTLMMFKDSFRGAEGVALLESLLLIRDDVVKEKDLIKFYVKEYFKN
jgi:hypothetical protein